LPGYGNFFNHHKGVADHAAGKMCEWGARGELYRE